MTNRLCGGLAMLALGLLGCVPAIQPVAPATQRPAFETSDFRAIDGAELPVRRWEPRGAKPKAVILALHGFNDYANAFALAGDYLSARGIAVVAYDQRGFGASVRPGIWAGEENLTRDVRAMLSLLATHYDAPIYLLGESMGGAVAVAACHGDRCPSLAGMILVAPALWGNETMNPFYRAALWAMAHLFPASRFSGADIEVLASDNIDMLRAMGRDPLVIKKARIDAIYGIVGLMDAAYGHIDALRTPLLLLYGAKDEVIPPAPIRATAMRLQGPHRLAYYPQGYHMLLRDLQREAVLADIAHWIEAPGSPLPSGADRQALRRMQADAE